MIALMRGLPAEGALWAATHDTGRPATGSAPAPSATPPPERKAPTVVTSLSGINPQRFYSGELTWQ